MVAIHPRIVRRLPQVEPIGKVVSQQGQNQDTQHYDITTDEKQGCLEILLLNERNSQQRKTQHQGKPARVLLRKEAESSKRSRERDIPQSPSSGKIVAKEVETDHLEDKRCMVIPRPEVDNRERKAKDSQRDD